MKLYQLFGSKYEYLKGKKAFLFDMDGTLVDSMPTYTSAMLRILDELLTKWEDMGYRFGSVEDLFP